ncbi:transmembrane protein with metallophosphoesterase domain-related [Anaeramoeba flamelloides]|uniref:Transmembrane protein with metallophosphoesterase domain-related n=1 Tax=Anaeramoeba flamelloides TaxID=1746091 RepID=A0AAV7ZEA4_9EUKA|nr:transmembrane protein with metallophosphoesterase domain-related [Anaeramoeba flamelloides]
MISSPFGFLSFSALATLFYLNKLTSGTKDRRSFIFSYLRDWFVTPFTYNVIFERSLMDWKTRRGFFDFRCPGDDPGAIKQSLHIFFLATLICPLFRILSIVFRLNRGYVSNFLGIFTNVMISSQLLAFPAVIIWWSIFFQLPKPFFWWVPCAFFSYIPMFQFLSILWLFWIPHEEFVLKFDPYRGYGKRPKRGNKTELSKLRINKKNGIPLLDIITTNPPFLFQNSDTDDLDRSNFLNFNKGGRNRKRNFETGTENENETKSFAENGKGNDNENDKSNDNDNHNDNDGINENVNENENDDVEFEETSLMLENQQEMDEHQEIHYKYLRIIQITDVHLGFYTSAKWIRNYCEKTVDRDPDVVLLTGDMFSGDKDNEIGIKELHQALQPLKQLSKGSLFACIGNHDMTVLQELIEIYHDIGAIVLRDQECVCKLGKEQIPVQVIGCDWYEHDPRPVHRLLKKIPYRKDVQLRLILSHATDNWKYLPKDDKSITFSGHTHGGLWGMTFFGWTCSIMGPFVPDQGVFIDGNKMLYVHKGTGYGSMIRLGIPPEDSVINLKFVPLNEDGEN